jgi:CheY-like chemotaxis protein
MDAQMPEMDGFTTTTTIRQQEQQTGTHLPIIALTAHAMKGDAERCLAAGMDAYVAKPLRVEELLVTIAQVLEHTAAAAPAAATPPIDLAAALENTQGDWDLLTELVELFLSDVPGSFTTLQAAISTGDALGTERAVHSLKGALGTVGARTAYELAAALEAMAREGRLDGASALAQKLAHALEQVYSFFTAPDWSHRPISPVML